MKKILVSIFLILSFSAFAQSINTLVIPEDYESLKSKYIQLANMYIEQKNDLNIAIKAKETSDSEVIKITKEHDKTIDILSDMTTKYENSISTITELKDSNEKLIKRLKESNNSLVTYDPVRVGFGLKYGKSLVSGNTIYTIENTYLFFNKVYGTIDVSIPLEISIGLGFYIN